MSALYRKVNLLVSREYFLRGKEFVRSKFYFFHEMKEYEAHATKYRNEKKSLPQRYKLYIRPIRVTVLVLPAEYEKFVSGSELSQSKVFFSGDI